MGNHENRFHVCAVATFTCLTLCCGVAIGGVDNKPHDRYETNIPKNEPIKVDASAIYLSGIALDDFKLKNEKWPCFKVMMESRAGALRVTFIPKDNVRRVGDELIVNGSACGRAITYIINYDGIIMASFYDQ
jgi:hypothetical protein